MQEFDFIVVGAGSAGAVLAARLSDNPSRRVLLLEEGPTDSSPYIRMPKGFGQLLTDPKHASFHPTTHDRGDGNPEIWLRGKMLGGSSGINGMVWNRGIPADYDELARLAPGWSWDEMLPYFKRIEDHELGETAIHGGGGPVPVRSHPERSPMHEALIAAGAGIGLSRREDINSIEQEGIGYLQANINRKGERVSAARGFLTPDVRRRQNLAIVTGTRVERVLFEGRRAVGVKGRAGDRPVHYRARGEVILCAGALSSPKLLQLSGIGPAEALQALGIPVIADRAAVGANLREHWLLMQFFELRDPAWSYNRAFAGLPLVANVLRYQFAGRGPLACSSSEIGAFIRTRPELARPDVQLMFSPYSFTVQNGAVVFDPFPGVQLYGFVLRPDSVGSIALASTDPSMPARIDPNYLSAESDRRASIAMVRRVRELMAQPVLQPFVVGETGPTTVLRTSEQILDGFRRMGQAGYHASGTCRMGEDAQSVVDPALRVRDVERLRIMDCSVCPQIIAGNTNAPMMAMAWRAAELIERDHR